MDMDKDPSIQDWMDEAIQIASSIRKMTEPAKAGDMTRERVEEIHVLAECMGYIVMQIRADLRAYTDYY